MTGIDYAAEIQWAKRELSKIGVEYVRKKAQIINTLADKLALIPTIEHYRICKIIKQELLGIVTGSYIESVLPPEYKRKYNPQNPNIYAKGYIEPLYEPPTEDLAAETEISHSKKRNSSLAYYHAHYKHTEQDLEIIRLDKENKALKREIISLDRRIKALGVKWHYREGYNPLKPTEGAEGQ